MSDCIIWTKGTNSSGYGVQRFQGKMHYAHRVTFFLHHGYWPQVCRHTCDNRACVKVEHLLDGTHVDNTKDMTERGRHVSIKLNHDTPHSTADPSAYNAERYRRQKAGTWVYFAAK